MEVKTRRFGVHASIAGGIYKALERAKALGCSTVQIFSHNPRGWALNEIPEGDARLFKERRKNLDISPVYVHCSYLINIAASSEDLRWKSVAMLREEMARADAIGADYVVLHTGSSFGEEEAGRKRAIDGLRVVSKAGSFRAGLLLENTAGEKGDIATSMKELGEIEGGSGGIVKGICFDTCHGFQAGYDIRADDGIAGLASEVKKHIRGGVRLIHLNDSKAGYNGHYDRHEHLGMGNIGKEGLRKFITHKGFSEIPLILETPKKAEGDDKRNLRKLREIMGPRLTSV